MYSGSTEFNNLIEKSGGNALITRFTFSDFSIEKFTKLEYYGGSNNSDDIAIGTTNMAYLDVNAITDKLITNQEFLFEVGMELSDGTVEYAPMGYFTVQKPDSDEDIVNFKAYDRMQKFEKPYVSSLAYPTDSLQILNELCTICGVELATPISNPITITDKLDGYTCREVLGYIAGIHGLFACFDRYGKLNLRWYSETPIEKQIGLIWSLTKSQSNYTVEKITLAKDNETTYTSGTGISGINHSNPYGTQAIADSIYTSLGNFTYRPCEISMLDDIRLDPWDMLKVTYLDGSVLTIPVMSLEHSFSSGETRVKSVGKTDTENEYSYSGPVTQTMDRMATELLVANRIIATKVDAEWVRANTLSADSAVIVDLKTNVAKIDTLIFGSASGTTIQTEFANAVIAQLGEAQIKSAMIESVSANKVTSGEIYTNLVKIYGDRNKRLAIADNTIQLSDDNDIIRMQVGEDSTGAYNIIIRNTDEEVIFDAIGVTEKGYHNGSIKDIAVADNANIGAEKLNIDSLFSVINNDGSNTLKSSKIYLDSEAQTLDVAFNTMTTNVTNLTKTTMNQGTQISVIQGQLESKIWQQDITDATTPLGEDITILSTQYSSLSQEVTGFKTEVSSTYTTKTEFNNLEIGGRNLVTYNNIVQFGTGSMDKSHFISSGTIIRSDLSTNGGFRFDSKSCYKPNTNYVLECYMTVLSGTLVNFRLLSGKGIKFISFTVDGVKYGNPLLTNFTEINDILNDKAQHHLVIKYATSATIPEDTGYQYTYFQPNSANATAIEYRVDGFCLRSGDKALGWTPAPEDTEAEITSAKTIATQTADKFNWLVQSGTSATDFTLTDRMAELTAEIISLNGNVKVNGDMLVDGTITGNKLNMSDIFSQNITATNLNITGGKIDVKSNRDIDIYSDLTINLNGIMSSIMGGNADVNTKVDTNGFTLTAINPNDNNDFFSWTLNENGLNVNNGTQTYNVFTIYNSGKLYIPKLMATDCAIEYGLLAKSIETKSAYASTYYHVYGSGATAIIKNITNYVTYQDYTIDVVAGYIYPDITWECPAGYEIVHAIPTIIDNTTSWNRFITITTQSVGNTGCRLVCYSSGAASITVRMNLTFRATT